MGFCTKPGGSDDKLWMESLPGGSKENPIIHNNPTCSWCSFLLCGTGGGMLGGDRAASSAGVCWALHSCGWGVSARLWVSCRHSVLSQGCVQGSLHSAPVQGCAPAACCGHRDIHHHFQPVALGDTGGFCGLGVSVSGQSGSSPTMLSSLLPQIRLSSCGRSASGTRDRRDTTSRMRTAVSETPP